MSTWIGGILIPISMGESRIEHWARRVQDVVTRLSSSPAGVLHTSGRCSGNLSSRMNERIRHSETPDKGVCTRRWGLQPFAIR